MNISVSVTGLDYLLAKWQYIVRTGLRKEITGVAASFSAKLLSTVRQRAPVETGGYRRRITARVEGFALIVESTDAYARRLEYGFVGEDSLGRHYSQSPQPHFRPAAEEITPEYVKALMAVVKGMAV